MPRPGERCRYPTVRRVALNQFSLNAILMVVAAIGVTCWLLTSFYPFGPAYALFFLFVCTAFAAWRIRQPKIGILSGVLLLSCLFCSFLIFGDGHPVPLEHLSRIQVGATTHQVKSILGKPSKINRSGDGDNWVYSSATWCYVVVEFAPDGTVLEVIHDH